MVLGRGGKGPTHDWLMLTGRSCPLVPHTTVHRIHILVFSVHTYLVFPLLSCLAQMVRKMARSSEQYQIIIIKNLVTLLFIGFISMCHFNIKYTTFLFRGLEEKKKGTKAKFGQGIPRTKRGAVQTPTHLMKKIASDNITPSSWRFPFKAYSVQS